MNLLIWFGFIGAAIFVNWLLIHKNIKPNHPLNAFITILLTAIFCHYDEHPHWFIALCGLSTYWFIFDTGLNIARGKLVWYLGQGSVIDRWSQKLPLQVVWIFKAMIAGFFIGAYYLNY